MQINIPVSATLVQRLTDCPRPEADVFLATHHDALRLYLWQCLPEAILMIVDELEEGITPGIIVPPLDDGDGVATTASLGRGDGEDK